MTTTAGQHTHVTLGVDTHLDQHVAVALDERGRRLGELVVPTTIAGYRHLLEWAAGFGDVVGVGVEGTGSYGAGLSRFLQQQQVEIMEADRPDRGDRRARGKTDSFDAEAAARAMLAQRLRTRPKAADGDTESLRLLRVARRGAVKARIQADQAMRAIVITAPAELREQVAGLTTVRLANVAERYRPGPMTSTAAAAKSALRSLARRRRDLVGEVRELDKQIELLVTRAAPQLLACRTSDRRSRPRCSWPPATTPSGYGLKPRSPTWPA